MMYTGRLRSVSVGILAVAAAVVLAGCSGGSSGSGSAASGGASGSSAPGKQIRIGVVPYDTPEQIMEQYTPFANFLGKRLGGTATITVATDYVDVINALQNGQIEIAYLNPLGYALAASRMQKDGHPLVPIAMPYVIEGGNKKGSLTYRGIIFVRKDSGINTLKDLKGKSFAFNEPASTSGYLYPFTMLHDAGINPQPAAKGGDLSNVTFSNATGVPPAVLNRQADAGAIYEEGPQRILKNPAEVAQLKIIAYTPPIPNGMLVTRSDLPAAEIANLKKAMNDINTDPAGKQALAKMDVAKWAPADDSLFDPVRKAAKILNLDLTVLRKKK